MSLTRQGRTYLTIGVLQWLLDWAMVVALSHAGLAIELANVLGRISGAALGFWLNGRFTFAGEHTTVGGPQLARFGLMWIGTTAVSTWALSMIATVVGLQWAWLAKPAVELALGIVGFALSRHWVYRR
jgi:putative flippase GtrA